MRISRWRQATLGVSCLALVLAAMPGVAAAEDDPFAPYDQQQLSWGPCPFTPIDGAKTAECALMTVPRDWAAPSTGVDLRVAISRVRATGTSQGVLLVNPGGPGSQGSSLAGDIAGLEPSLNQQYDIIGMDPRGTGQEGSTAADEHPVACAVPTGRLPQDPHLDARNRSPHSIAEHQQTPRAVAEACQSNALTPYLTTWQTAHDMELIRLLLGRQKLNYLGYSYGTWLGAKYASLFPAGAGKVVLDSSVNWQGRLQADFEDFPVIDQRQFDKVFLPWMSRQFPNVVGATPEQAKANWERARAYLGANGLAPDLFDAIFVGMGSHLRWLLAALIFQLGVEGADGAGATTDPATSPDLRAQLDAQSRATYGVPAADLTVARVVAATPPPDYTQVSDTRYAVACGDQPTRSAAWYKRLSDRQGPVYPLYGWAYGISEPCGFWSDPPRQALPDLPAQVASHVLVVQGEFDPQTGYDQASAAVRAAPGVTMVSVDDAAYHGQYALTGNPCVDGMVNVFLLDNSRPGNTVCPSVPLLGETQVYPVPGPVRAHSVTPYAAAGEVGGAALRAATQDLVSRVNRTP